MNHLSTASCLASAVFPSEIAANSSGRSHQYAVPCNPYIHPFIHNTTITVRSIRPIQPDPGDRTVEDSFDCSRRIGAREVRTFGWRMDIASLRPQITASGVDRGPKQRQDRISIFRDSQKGVVNDVVGVGGWVGGVWRAPGAKSRAMGERRGRKYVSRRGSGIGSGGARERKGANVPGNSVSETGERINGGAVIEERSPEKEAILHQK